MTNVEDSRTTIKQGKNIGALTYVTIAYLPFGYVTVSPPSPRKPLESNQNQGLFSENHGILPASAGKALYAAMIVLLTAATYGLAGALISDKISTLLGAPWRKLTDKTMVEQAALNGPPFTSGLSGNGNAAARVMNRDISDESLHDVQHLMFQTTSPGSLKGRGKHPVDDPEMQLELGLVP